MLVEMMVGKMALELADWLAAHQVAWWVARWGTTVAGKMVWIWVSMQAELWVAEMVLVSVALLVDELEPK